MDSDAKLEKVIIEYINKFRINDGDYQSLRTSLKEELTLLERFFQEFTKRQMDIVAEIKGLKLNLVNVSERAGVTRSTIYNNSEVLKVYIGLRIKEIEEKDMFSQRKLENKEKEVELLNEYVKNMRIHSVQSQALTDVIDDLESEMGDLNKINQANTERIYQLEKENRDLIVRLKDYEKGKIVSINR